MQSSHPLSSMNAFFLASKSISAPFINLLFYTFLPIISSKSSNSYGGIPMKPFREIYLTPSEKRSLFLFHFKKKRLEQKIKCFHELYVEYVFIKPNLSSETDDFGCFIPDGTFSLSSRYEHYRVYRKEKRLEILPNWIAISISLFSFVVSLLTLLSQL